MSQQTYCWQTKPLGDVCKVIGGGTPSKRNEDFYKGDIPWATVRDMNVDIITQTDFRITNDAVKQSSTNVIPAGNVIIATRVGLGKVCLLNQDTAINQDLRGIIPLKSETIEVHFLFWWLKSIARLIEKEGTGATVQGVKLPFVKSLPFPLPPLPEQKRIVAILDDAFARIDTAIANTEKNLANVRELFESYLNNVFTQKGEGWEEQPVNDISHVVSGHSFKSGDFSDSHEVRAIKIANVGVRKFVDDPSNTLPKDFLTSYAKFSIPKGSIVIALTRSIIAEGLKVAVVPDEYDGALLNQRVAAVIASSDIVLKDYLYYFLCSSEVVDYVKRKANTLMQPNLSITDLKKLPVPLPPLSLQKQIVENIRAIGGASVQLESLYRQKLEALTKLKQSILQKAFAGELTADMNHEELVN